MEIYVTIERIDNGYIVTGNDITKTKTYYPSLVNFAECWIIEQLKERDKLIREHSTPEKPFSFKLTSDL